MGQISRLQIASLAIFSAALHLYAETCCPGVKHCEGGSGGVALFKLPQGVVVMKPQNHGKKHCGSWCSGVSHVGKKHGNLRSGWSSSSVSATQEDDSCGRILSRPGAVAAPHLCYPSPALLGMAIILAQ